MPSVLPWCDTIIIALVRPRPQSLPGQSRVLIQASFETTPSFLSGIEGSASRAGSDLQRYLGMSTRQATYLPKSLGNFAAWGFNRIGAKGFRKRSTGIDAVADWMMAMGSTSDGAFRCWFSGLTLWDAAGFSQLSISKAPAILPL